MLVKLLMKLEVGEIACAGFDGYSDTEDNYCNTSYNGEISSKVAAEESGIKAKFIIG